MKKLDEQWKKNGNHQRIEMHIRKWWTKLTVSQRPLFILGYKVSIRGRLDAGMLMFWRAEGEFEPATSGWDSDVCPTGASSGDPAIALKSGCLLAECNSSIICRISSFMTFDSTLVVCFGWFAFLRMIHIEKMIHFYHQMITSKRIWNHKSQK